MEIVNGFNIKREIVKKELHTSEKNGAVLRYEGEDTILEPDLKLWNKIYRPNDPSEGYKNAFFHMTEDCNKNCEYCYNRDLLFSHPGDTTLKQFIKGLEEFVTKDTRDVVPFKEHIFDGIQPMISFVGGEPTVSDSLIPFVHYIANTRKNKMFIYTNGIKLLDIDYLKQFPNTSQIMWSISTDINTEESFIRKVTENIMKFNFEYGYNIIVGTKEVAHVCCTMTSDPVNELKATIKKNLEIDKICRSYEPQEIRYRAFASQKRGYSGYLSSVLKFVAEARDIPYNHFLENMWFGHAGIVSSLSHLKTENPNTGKIAVALIPIWKRTFAESLCKWGSFIINSFPLNLPSEGHMGCYALYKWRMEHTKDYISEGTKVIWGKFNNDCVSRMEVINEHNIVEAE